MIHLLQHATVYTPELLGTADVLIAGGQILAIAPTIPVPNVPWPIDVHDLRGKVLAPGLIDLHTHLTGGGGEGGAHTRVPAPQLTDLTLAGVTTAIGLLGTDGSTRTIAELLACARALDTLGITTFCYTGAYEVPPPTLTGSVRGDIVHIDRIVAVGEVAISDHRSSQPTFEEFIRLAADAHVAGMMTGKAGLLHLHMGDGARGLELVRRALQETEIPARVFHPTHCNRNFKLWEEAKALSTQGPTLDITAFPPDDAGPSAATAIHDYLTSGLDPTRITLSSDGGGCLPDFDAAGNLVHMEVGSSRSLLECLRDVVAKGIPVADALALVTSNAATLFRLHGKGQLAVGRDADLVVLEPDLTVWGTLAKGRWLVRDGVPTTRGPFEGG
jgi:beta-aspartyl-dipeptidase (metallo-type)